MKRLAAILFLNIMLFNLCGYKLIIHFLHNKSDAQLSVLIDNDEFEEEELITIKTRLSLPYYTNSVTYERVDGVISIDGVYYNYVKRRVFNDSLELLCLPNPAKTVLEKIEVGFSKNVTDNTSDDKSNKKLTVIKNTQPEFYEKSAFAPGPPEINPINLIYSCFTFYLPSISTKVHTPPPNSLQNVA
ncbi:MAG TPA: hypothetical protein VD794_03120 [Flavisolibacter sp.]|nr:hypothetical protein [Flavisolibacter sp.]